MDIGKAFEVAFNRKKEKNWEKIYVVVDIHDTILRACYENEETYDYYPAQGYFTVNYPKSGLFKMDLIPAYRETSVNKDMYEIYVYDKTLTTTDKWRKIKADGETITNKTVYFQVRASQNVAETHPQYKAQIDIWFKATDSNEWVSGYSEIRATYACIIPAVN